MNAERGFLMRESWRRDVVLACKLEIDGGRDAPGCGSSATSRRPDYL